jgi:rhodanese-related sulfurtransferase
MSKVKYVDPSELATWLRSGTPKLAIIDVRDADFPYGNIKGCVNIPAAKFHAEAETVVENYKGMDKIVVHCALSQVITRHSSQK